MTPRQYRSAITTLGISDDDAPTVLGVSRITAFRWNRSGITGTAAILLRLLMSGKITVDDVAKATRETDRRKYTKPGRRNVDAEIGP